MAYETTTLFGQQSVKTVCVRSKMQIFMLFHLDVKSKRTKLLHFHSPLLTQSRLVYFPPTNKMF